MKEDLGLLSFFMISISHPIEHFVQKIQEFVSKVHLESQTLPEIQKIEAVTGELANALLIVERQLKQLYSR